jgi:hypothetical protein
MERLKEHANSAVVRRYLLGLNRDEDTLLAARRKILELEEAEIALKKTKTLAESSVRELTSQLVRMC